MPPDAFADYIPGLRFRHAAAYAILFSPRQLFFHYAVTLPLIRHFFAIFSRDVYADAIYSFRHYFDTCHA